MKIDDLVAVSGMSGLYKIGTSRGNGMIVEDLDSGRSKFVSMRKHQFTPLGTVAIYTETDATELTRVFEIMYEKEAESDIPALNSPAQILFTYFGEILPDFDRDRVLISDVKKVIKWYQFLKKRDIIPFTETTEPVTDTESE